MPKFLLRLVTVFLVPCLLTESSLIRVCEGNAPKLHCRVYREFVTVSNPSPYAQEALASVEIFSSHVSSSSGRSVRHRIVLDHPKAGMQNASVETTTVIPSLKESLQRTGFRLFTLTALIVTASIVLLGVFVSSHIIGLAHIMFGDHFIRNVAIATQLVGAIVYYGLSNPEVDANSKTGFIAITPFADVTSVAISRERMDLLINAVRFSFSLTVATFDPGQVLTHVISMLSANSELYESKRKRFDKYLSELGVQKSKDRRSIIASFFLVLGNKTLINDLLLTPTDGAISPRTSVLVRDLALSAQGISKNILRSLISVASEPDTISSFLERDLGSNVFTDRVKQVHQAISQSSQELPTQDKRKSLPTDTKPATTFPEDITAISARFEALNEYVTFRNPGIVLIPQRPGKVLADILRDMKRLESRRMEFLEARKESIVNAIYTRKRGFLPPLTQRQLAKMSGLNVMSLSRVMTKRNNPEPQTLERIGFALGTRPEQFTKDYRDNYGGRDPYVETTDLIYRGREIFGRFVTLALRSWNFEALEFATNAEIGSDRFTEVTQEYFNPYFGGVRWFGFDSMARIVRKSKEFARERQVRSVWVSIAEYQSQRVIRQFMESLEANVRSAIERGEYSWDEFGKATQELYAATRGEPPGEKLQKLGLLMGSSENNLVASYKAAIAESNVLKDQAMVRRRRALKAFRQMIPDQSVPAQKLEVSITKAAESIGITLQHLSRVHRDLDVVFPLYRLGHLADYLEAHGIESHLREAWGRDDLVEIRFGVPIVRRATFLRTGERDYRVDPVWGVEYRVDKSPQTTEKRNSDLTTLNEAFGDFGTDRPLRFLTSIRDVFMINENDLFKNAGLPIPEALNIRPLVMQPRSMLAFINYLEGVREPPPNRLLKPLWDAAENLPKVEQQFLLEDVKALWSKYRQSIQWFVLNSFRDAPHLILVRETSPEVTPNDDVLELNVPSVWFFNAGVARGFQVKGKVISIEVPLESIESIDFEGDPAVFRDRVAVWVYPGNYKVHTSETDASPYRGNLRSEVMQAFRDVEKALTDKRPSSDVKMFFKVLLDRLETSMAPENALSLVKSAARFAAGGIERMGGTETYYGALNELLAIVRRELTTPSLPISLKPELRSA